jgi:FAD/FMN-containing dehydrogenase
LEPLDRRAFLIRAGAVAAGALVPGWVTASAGGATDPRVRALARAVRGRVLTPASPGYNVARLPVNSRYSGIRPLAILRAAGVGDVQQAVRWAAGTGVPIVARSGGHSYAGYSTTRGLIVDLSGFDGIRPNRTAGTVRVGAGARLIDVYSTLIPLGVTIPAGSCPTVGMGGLALGGGVGFASRAMGTTSDNVQALTMVAANGAVVQASARTNEDLLWASRGGGGGNFGIVTGFTLKTHPIGPAAYFTATFPWSAAEDVVTRWQSWAPEAPDGLFSICSLSTGAGAPVLNVFGQYLGSEAALQRLLRRLTAAARPSSLSVGTSSYLNLQLRWAGCLGKSPSACRALPYASFAAKSDYVSRPLPARAVAIMTRWLGQRQASGQGSGALLLDSYGGAINRVAPGATAFVHRDNLFSIQYGAYWGTPSAEAPGLAWIRGVHRALRPFVSGFAYQNYVDPDLADYRHAWYGANYPRLAQVKKDRDPHSLFHFPQAITATA